MKNAPIIYTTKPLFLLLGGACVGTALELAKYLSDDVVKHDDAKIVLVSATLVEKLSPSELNAVIDHEVGHIHLGHAGLPKQYGGMDNCIVMMPDGNYFIDNLSYEFEADAYSADRNGSEAMGSALVNTMAICMDALADALSKQMSQEECDERMVDIRHNANITLSPRLINLSLIKGNK